MADKKSSEPTIDDLKAQVESQGKSINALMSIVNKKNAVVAQLEYEIEMLKQELQSSASMTSD